MSRRETKRRATRSRVLCVAAGRRTRMSPRRQAAHAPAFGVDVVKDIRNLGLDHFENLAGGVDKHELGRRDIHDENKPAKGREEKNSIGGVVGVSFPPRPATATRPSSSLAPPAPPTASCRRAESSRWRALPGGRGGCGAGSPSTAAAARQSHGPGARGTCGSAPGTRAAACPPAWAPKGKRCGCCGHGLFERRSWPTPAGRARAGRAPRRESDWSQCPHP